MWRLPPSVRHPLTGRVDHNDLCPANTVFANGRPYGFIDWDIAGPARNLHDLAYAAYSFVSLRPDRFWPRPGCATPPNRPTRLRLFCDAYGVDDRLGLLDAVEALLCDELADTVELGQRGVWPYEMMLARGEDRFRRWETRLARRAPAHSRAGVAVTGVRPANLQSTARHSRLDPTHLATDPTAV